MKKKTKLIMILSGAALLVLAAGYTVFIAPLLKQEKWVYKEATVERGVLKVGVTESGSLEYGISSLLYDLDLSVVTDSDEEDEEDEEVIQKYLKVEEVYAATGQRIQQGDALVKFTEDSVSDVRKLLNSALIDAKSDYNEAVAEYDLSALEAKTDYELLKIDEKYASAIYQASAKTIDNEISTLEIQLTQCSNKVTSLEEAVTEAQEAYKEALATYEDAQETMSITGTDHTSNFLTVQSEYVSARTRYQNAKQALAQAQDNVSANEEQMASLKEQIALAKARYEIDKLDVNEAYKESLLNGENAQITYDAQMESLKETLKEAEEEKLTLEEQLSAFEAFVGEDGILYADGEGIVTEVNYEAGDTLTQMGTIVAYAAPQDMTISVDMTQEDVVALSVGDTVEVSFTAYPDTIYEGKILSIDTTATSRNSATISYQVVIGVEGDTRALYGGMTADITFVTEEKADVLYVSRKAIVEENDKTYVYVQTALGGKELKQVQTGISNGTSIEITEGLSEGDTIYIASKVSSEEEISAQEEGGQDASSLEDMFSNGQMPDIGEMMENGQMPDLENMPGGGQMPGGNNR